MVRNEPNYDFSNDDIIVKFNNIIKEFPHIINIFSKPGRHSASSRAIINKAYKRWKAEDPKIKIKTFNAELKAFVQSTKKEKKIKFKKAIASKHADVEKSSHQASSDSSCNIIDTILMDKEIIKEEHYDSKKVIDDTGNNYQDSMFTPLGNGELEQISDGGSDVIAPTKLNTTQPELTINSVRSLSVPQGLYSPRFNVSSHPSYYSEDEDDIMTLAKGYVIKLRKLSGDQLILADKLINETLVNAQFGLLTRSSSINKIPRTKRLCLLLKSVAKMSAPAVIGL